MKMDGIHPIGKVLYCKQEIGNCSNSGTVEVKRCNAKKHVGILVRISYTYTYIFIYVCVCVCVCVCMYGTNHPQLKRHTRVCHMCKSKKHA